MKKTEPSQRPFIKPQLSLQTCREILCKDGEQYTDEEINEIRALIICLVEIDYLHFKKWMEKEKEKQIQVQDEKIIPLQKDANNSQEYKATG